MNYRPLIIAAALLASGCSFSLIGKASAPPPFLMSLTPSAENSARADTGKTVVPSDILTITTPFSPGVIAQDRIPVTRDGVAFAYIKDAYWVEQPARLFQRLLAETIKARTGRTVLDPRQFEADPGAQLSGQLLHFEVDEPASQAVVIFEASLTNAKSKAVRTRRFEARVPIAVIDAKSSGDALNKAANMIAGEVSAWASE
jgi:cholesterol transport system auxiliary component